MTKTENSAHHTVITNLQKQLESKRAEYNRLMMDYTYRAVIKQVVDEKLGPEPKYIFNL